MDEQQLRGITAAPNESKVCGALVKVERGPEGVGYVWKIRVDESYDINGLPNFTKDRVGKIIPIYVPPEMGKDYKEADMVKVHVSFQGDERGGAFFLVENRPAARE